MEKMTYAKAVRAILNGEDMTAEVCEKLQALALSLERKTEPKSGKAKEKNDENENIRHVLYTTLANSQAGMTIPEIIAFAPELADYSNQKISSQLSALIKAEKLVRVKIKGKTYFKVATAEVTGEAISQ